MAVRNTKVSSNVRFIVASLSSKASVSLVASMASGHTFGPAASSETRLQPATRSYLYVDDEHQDRNNKKRNRYDAMYGFYALKGGKRYYACKAQESSENRISKWRYTVSHKSKGVRWPDSFVHSGIVSDKRLSWIPLHFDKLPWISRDTSRFLLQSDLSRNPEGFLAAGNA